MAELVYEEILKSSEDLVVGDEFKIGDLNVQIDRVTLNKKNEMVLDLTIVGATAKIRSKMMLIIPKKVPVITLK